MVKLNRGEHIYLVFNQGVADVLSNGHIKTYKSKNRIPDEPGMEVVEYAPVVHDAEPPKEDA